MLASAMAQAEGADIFAGAGGFTYDLKCVAQPRGDGRFLRCEQHPVIVSLDVRYRGRRRLRCASCVLRRTHRSPRPRRLTLSVAASNASPITSTPIPGPAIRSITVSPIDTSRSLTFTTLALTYPGTWQFGVRAFYIITGLEEQNIDCVVTTILDASGIDITNRPFPPPGSGHSPGRRRDSASSGSTPPTSGARETNWLPSLYRHGRNARLWTPCRNRSPTVLRSPTRSSPT